MSGETWPWGPGDLCDAVNGCAGAGEAGSPGSLLFQGSQVIQCMGEGRRIQRHGFLLGLQDRDELPPHRPGESKRHFLPEPSSSLVRA